MFFILVEGLDIEIIREDGSIDGNKAWLIDFDNPDNNDWPALNQYTVIEHQNNRRPDVVLFINGLPLGVLELKNPGDESATLERAFNQLQTYKQQIPSLSRTNAVLAISNGLQARIGSLTADSDASCPGGPWMAWKSPRLLSLVRDFTVFGDTGSGLVKIITGYHQFHAVHHVMEQTIKAASPEGDRRIGVIWYTQGSGKSLLMAFYAGWVVSAEPWWRLMWWIA